APRRVPRLGTGVALSPCRRLPRGLPPVGAGAEWVGRNWRREGAVDGNVAIDRAPVVEGAPGSPGADRQAPPPLALRRGSDPRRPPDWRGGRHLSRLLQESHHG